MTILVVDDEATIRDLCVEALEREGDTVFAVGSTREAEELLGAARFDAIILDDMLPDKRGTRWLPTLYESRPDLPERTVVIFGGELSMGEMKALDYFGARWIRKPFELHELVEVVHAIGPR